MLLSPYEARLDALRKELAARGLDGFVIPLSDEHMSEYVGEYAQRLRWLTGFDGSAGTAVVLAERAAIFVDGRYTLQARDQVDANLWDHESVPQTSPAKWLRAQAGAGARIGYDPWLHSRSWTEATAKALGKAGAALVAVDSNPLDAIWTDRPAPSAAPAILHPECFAGRSSAEKLADVSGWLRAEGLDAVVIAALDSIAWLFNIRGSDVARTPVVLAFAIVDSKGDADLFVTPGKIPPEVATHLGQAVQVRPRDDFTAALEALAGKRVAVDKERCVAAIFDRLEQGWAELAIHRDPTVLPRAVKNRVEQAGHRAAQLRDGAAVARFLHWLSAEAPKGGVSELDAAERLHALRRETGELRDLSFDTISGSGPNGAIVHYRVSEETNRRLEPGSVYLVDSGGQYADGTTDITRTVWIGGGDPPAEVRERFTRVLKGHIALATASFPRGTAGYQLDTLARQFLWQAGLDYAHGTGHGVGSFLSVHEGPQRISKAAGGQAGTEQELLPGMIISNEPGYYKSGAYGIRIENLVLVEPREIAGAEGDWLGFETLTLVPIDRTLVAPALLSSAEKDWWNAYHARVAKALAPQLEGEALAWLRDACLPL